MSVTVTGAFGEITEADRIAGAALLGRLVVGEQAAAIVRSAMHHGLLAAAIDFVTAAEVASTLTLPPERVGLAFAALHALDVLEKDGEHYRLTRAIRAALAPEAPQTIPNALAAANVFSQQLARSLSPGFPQSALSDDDLLAVANGVWGLASSPIALASFQAVDEQMPEIMAIWRAGARHMELGCGAGRDLLRVAVPYPKTEVVGVDVNGLVLEEVRRQAIALDVLDRVDMRHCDARTITDSAAFDSVMWSQMFFPATSRRETIAVIRRALKPRAYLIMPLLPASFAIGHDDKKHRRGPSQARHADLAVLGIAVARRSLGQMRARERGLRVPSHGPPQPHALHADAPCRLAGLTRSARVSGAAGPRGWNPYRRAAPDDVTQRSSPDGCRRNPMSRDPKPRCNASSEDWNTPKNLWNSLPRHAPPRARRGLPMRFIVAAPTMTGHPDPEPAGRAG